MLMEEILSEWLKASGERDFLLVIAGRISGVHDGKGKHKPIDYQIDGSTVTIQFAGAEQLRVSNAVDLTMSPNGELAIRDASEARFTWYSHDDPLVAPKLCEEVFGKGGRGVGFSRTGAPFATSAFLANFSDQFVVLRPV
jgi:hypothetical protein